MRLAIADPPYLGRARIWYGDGMTASQRGRNHGGTARITGPRPADNHDNAAVWDNPATHADLVKTLVTNYDGWAVAMAHDNVRHYLQWTPADTRIAAWLKTQAMPGGARVINRWEPVLVWIPPTRRSSTGCTMFPPDAILTQRPNTGFPGAKPNAWTRWVLDMLGYNPDTDTVDDLFPGSGAVGRETMQGVLL